MFVVFHDSINTNICARTVSFNVRLCKTWLQCCRHSSSTAAFGDYRVVIST